MSTRQRRKLHQNLLNSQKDDPVTRSFLVDESINFRKSDSHTHQHAIKRKRKKKRIVTAVDDNGDEEPFLFLMVKVGLALACIFLMAYKTSTYFGLTSDKIISEEYTSGDDAYHALAKKENDNRDSQTQRLRTHELNQKKLERIIDSTISKHMNEKSFSNSSDSSDTRIPLILGPESKFDAYGLASRFTSQRTQKLSKFFTETLSLRGEFASRYGGENSSRAMLSRGLVTFYNSTTHELPIGLRHTANRMLEAKQDDRPFKMAFGG